MKITPPYLLASGIGQNDKEPIRFACKHIDVALVLIEHDSSINMLTSRTDFFVRYGHVSSGLFPFTIYF